MKANKPRTVQSGRPFEAETHVYVSLTGSSAVYKSTLNMLLKIGNFYSDYLILSKFFKRQLFSVVSETHQAAQKKIT